MSILKGEGTHTILYGSADIHNGLRANRGYLARPDHSGSHPTLLISHDWAGITSSLKATARTLARHGYAVVVPDYYRGHGNTAPWPADRLESDLEGAYRFLASSDTPWVGHVGVFGLGSGAPPAVAFVLGHPEVRALVLVSPLTTFGLGDVMVPTLGMYGKGDQPAEDWEQLRGQAPQVEWVLYGAPGHNFFDEGSDSFDAGVADDAMNRILEFLARTLSTDAPGLSVSQ